MAQNRFSKSVMLCCYEPPGFGGAASQTYELLLKMQSDGIDATLVNLIDERDREYFAYAFGERLGNPGGTAGVHNVNLSSAPFDPQPELEVVLGQLAPDLILAVGHIAVAALARYQGCRPLVYYAVGCSMAQLMVLDWTLDAELLTEYLECWGRPPLVEESSERRAVEAATLVIANSVGILDQYRALYPSWTGKFYERPLWSAEWIAQRASRYVSLAKPFCDREIDLLFIASSWERKVKNYPLVKRLAKRFSGHAVHVVGEVRKKIPGVVHHGLVADPDVLFNLIGNARAVVCPSVIDAAPGILFEASALDCNVVASRNCGNWQICHPQLLTASLYPSAFETCIERALESKYEDNLKDFIGQGCYRNLIDTLMVL
jgi:glycosyltransferase involved in cell wall biosynthesis